MPTIRTVAVMTTLMLTLAVTACGRKGPLERVPNPPAGWAQPFEFLAFAAPPRPGR